MNLMKVNYAVKNVMNTEKPIAKNMEIDTTRNKGKDMKKMKSIEKRNRNKYKSRNTIVACDVWNKSMSRNYFYDHIKTKKHQHNLENQ